MQEVFDKLGIGINFEFSVIFASLIWIRMLTVIAVIPFLFGKPVPRKVRVGGAMVITMFLYPYLKPAVIPEMPDDFLIIFALYMKEAFIGLTIGLSASFIFYGFDAAGRMVDNQRGASLARVLIPQLGQQGSLSGQLLFQMAIVLYLIFGGHLLFFNSLFKSFELVPLLEFPNVQPGLFPMMDLFIVLSGKVLALAVQIAAPVIISILLADIILGLTNRVAPQINVWELGFNIRGFVGILSLFFAFTIIARQIYSYSLSSNRYTKNVITLWSGVIPEELKEVETPPELKNLFFRPTGEEIKAPSVWDTTIRALTKEEAEKLPEY